MTTSVRKVFASLVLLCAVPLGSGVARADEPRLITMWTTTAPSDPLALAADERGAVSVGREDEVVLVDDAGATQWRVRLTAGVSAPSIALGGELVIVAVDGGFTALTRATGEVQWDHEMIEPKLASIGIVAGAPAVALLDELGKLEVLDGRTGAMRWTTSVAVDHKVFAARAWLLDQLVVQWWADGAGAHLRAYAAAGGPPLWSHDAPHATSIPTVDDEGSIIFAENVSATERRVIARLVRLGSLDGREQWSRSLRCRAGFSPFVTTALGEGGVAFVDVMGRVVNVDPATGRTLWKWKTRLAQIETDTHVLGDFFAMTTYGTGVLAASMNDGYPVEIPGIEPGQTAMTIQASAAAGNHLYLLVTWPFGDPQIWMLEPEVA